MNRRAPRHRQVVVPLLRGELADPHERGGRRRRRAGGGLAPFTGWLGGDVVDRLSLVWTRAHTSMRCSQRARRIRAYRLSLEAAAPIVTYVLDTNAVSTLVK